MESFLIILLATACVLLPFHLGQKYGIVRLVSPMHLLSYFCFFGFLVKVVVYATYPHLAFYRRYVDSPWADMVGALYLSLFIFLMCLGYRVACVSFCRADNVAAARFVAGSVTRRGALFVLSLGIAAATVMVIVRARGATGLDIGLLAGLNTTKQINLNDSGVGSTLAGIKTFFIVPKFAFILLLANGIVTGRAITMVAAALLGAVLCLIALISGDRFELVEMFIFALTTYLILGGGFSLKWATVVVVSLTGILVLSAHMTALRLGAESGRDLTDIFGALATQMVASTYFLDINVAVMVTDRVTPAALLLGESYLWWSYGWVPRAIWFDKPAIDLGSFFKSDVMQIHTGGAFNVTGPGEAFINFSWAGIWVGSALGWVYRKGEAFLLSPQNSIRYGTFLLYPILFYPFIQASLQSSFSAFIVGAVAQFVVIALLMVAFVIRYRIRVPQTNNIGGQPYVV